MPWQERVKPATYESPSGAVFNLIYEDVGRSVTKKTSEWNFPDAPGTYIQDLGPTGFRYPFTLFFTGDNHDLIAQEFMNALLEKGIGRLTHPVYGIKDVVPFGEISQQDNLKTAANQSVFKVTFFDTIGAIFPFPQADPKAAAVASIETFNEKLSDELAESLDIANETERLTFKSALKAGIDGVKSAFDAITKAQKKINDAFNNVYNSINEAIDLLISRPATLAFQVAALLQTPGRLIDSLDARIDGYIGLISSIVDPDKNIEQPAPGNTAANSFLNNDLFVSTALSGYVASVINWQFSTKTEALTAAEGILNEFERITAFRDQNYASLGLIDTGGKFQAMQEMVAITAGFLVQISFTLKTERIIVLDRARTIVDLSAEIYGEVDAKLDFLISSNDLSGSEILELPKGRQIRYFV